MIVDDGSADETGELCATWIAEGRISIQYFWKENGGKPSAYNVGIEKAQGDLFTIVDSDDYLTEDAVETIRKDWNDIEPWTNSLMIGLIYFRKNKEGDLITKYKRKKTNATLLDFYRKHGLKGDTMLVYRTNVVRKYKFPYFEGEKFVPESYIYDLLDDEGSLHIVQKAIYVCEYLPDGYTASMRKVNHDNPQGYEAYIMSRIKKDKSIRDIIEDTIKYIAIEKVKGNKAIVVGSQHKLITLFLLLPGWIFYKRVYSKYE